jgi:hypothetical protein
MKIFKKLFYLAVILLIFSPAIDSELASAQCNIFDFPLIQKNNLLFFSCELGEIQKLDYQNNISSVPSKNNLGGFVHNFIWSPDGNNALILAENVSAATQTLELYSPEREIDSLNWWVYDLRIGKARLLNKNIISIGWTSNDEVVYNWNNATLSTAKINDLDSDKHIELANITGDSVSLDEVVSPVNLNDTILFPIKKGFYTLNLSNKKVKYYLLSDGIQKIIANTFEQNIFIIKSGNSLYKFTISDENISALEKEFSATDLAFLNKNSLVIVEADGKAYSYDIQSKVKTMILLNLSGAISGVFSMGNEDEFIFTIGNNVYRKNIKNDSSVLLIGKESNNIVQPETSSATQSDQNKEPGSSLTPVEQQQTAAPQESKIGSIMTIIIITILMAIGIFTAIYLMYLRKNKK